ETSCNALAITVAGSDRTPGCGTFVQLDVRRPVTEGLDLDAVGVKTGASGEIVVDSRLATSNPRVWAAGDATGHREFVYVAAAHGALAVDNAFTDALAEVDYRHLP
ncbi:FAD-dependent oxidoreductase, partial [Streptococcus anginosus]|nr:FAD-dependent oxidoreductase [Streptococcus anginosus]